MDDNVYLGRWKLIGGQDHGVHRDERHDYRVEQRDLRQLPAEPADSVIILGAVNFRRYLPEFVPPPLNGVFIFMFMIVGMCTDFGWFPRVSIDDLAVEDKKLVFPSDVAL